MNALDGNSYLRVGEEIIVPETSKNYFEYYTVNKGDSIYAISRRYNINPELLASVNGLNNADYIYPGQVILIPKSNYSYYITKEGDTLDSVVNLFGTNKDKFLDETKQLIQDKQKVDNINRLIGSGSYERNPRLLANFTDEARETALNDLQNLTNIRFMDELENIRAREAFEKLTPGQGGGSGSTQGIQNLVRGGVTTSAAGLGGAMGGIPGAILAPALSLSAFSPKIMGKGTIKNIGNLYRNAENWQRLVPEEITRILSPALIQGIYGD